VKRAIGASAGYTTQAKLRAIQQTASLQSKKTKATIDH